MSAKADRSKSRLSFEKAVARYGSAERILKYAKAERTKDDWELNGVPGKWIPVLDREIQSPPSDLAANCIEKIKLIERMGQIHRLEAIETPLEAMVNKGQDS